jgi:integrase
LDDALAAELGEGGFDGFAGYAVVVGQAGLGGEEVAGWERDAHLHDARHTAATVLLILGVPTSTVMAIMGWSSASMAARYQHQIDAIRRDVAQQVGGLLWSAEDETLGGSRAETPPEEQ